MMRYKKNVNEGAHVAGGGGDSSCFLPALAAVAQKKKTVASLGSHFS